MAPKERPVAVIAPAMRSIKLYADGRIDYQGKSGSVIGATARIEKSGEKHRLRDTRKVLLRIEGPDIAIAAPLPAAAFQLHRHAEEFVARVNAISNGAGGSDPAPAVRSAPGPAKTTDQSRQGVSVAAAQAPAPGNREAELLSMEMLIGQLERLGKLRDSGVLTEDEFQAQKAALLRAAQKS
jgi:Short C-terminal domain